MSGLYTAGKVAMESAGINLTTDDIRAILIDTTYTANLATDAHLSDIVSGKRVTAGIRLTTPSLTGSVFDADDVLFAAVSNVTGNQIGNIVIYKNTGVESTSTLIHVHDTGAGFPFTPIGADITVRWSNGAYRIFQL